MSDILDEYREDRGLIPVITHMTDNTCTYYMKKTPQKHNI